MAASGPGQGMSSRRTGCRYWGDAWPFHRDSLAAVIVMLGWLWIRSLSRALVSPDSSTRSSQVRAAALPLARYGLRGAVATRFWIYQRREPLSLVYWGMTAVIAVAASISSIIGPQHHPGVTFLSAVLGAAFSRIEEVP